MTSYLPYGYIPMEDSVPEAFHKKEQVSRTLEYAFDDYALSVLAKSLKKTDDCKTLQQRALNYRNVFDRSTGMVRRPYSNGTWYSPFLPEHREPYITEGTPRQYSFYMPQDMQGSASLMGGAKAMENALEILFRENEYWHGSGPGHPISFMYNYTAAPWKTQEVVHRILEEEYNDGPGGLSGNDDAGQMSAWQVFAALGLYPLNPVSGKYLLWSPLFDKTEIRVGGAKTYRLICHRKSKQAVYIERVRLNGKPYEKIFIRHDDLVKGGTLESCLGSQPTNWAAKNSEPARKPFVRQVRHTAVNTGALHKPLLFWAVSPFQEL